MSNTFAAAFSVEDGHGYCFDYENIPQLRSMKIPPELETLLNTKVRNKENAKIASLSIGVDSRYWIRYFEDGKGWSNAYGPAKDDWVKLEMWLTGVAEPRVILGPRKSWLAYEVRRDLSLLVGLSAVRSPSTQIRTRAAAKDDPTASTDAAKAIVFDSDDNVPGELLRWMKNQTTPPTCVTIGSNKTYCAISTNGYVLSGNFQEDSDLVNFLEAAKVAQKLSGVRVTFSNVGANANILPYYVASLGNRVRVWNVHDTAEKVLRSRAYADFCADYDAVDKEIADLKNRLGDAAVKTDVNQAISELTTKVGNAAVKQTVDQTFEELRGQLANAAVKSEVEIRVSDSEKQLTSGFNDIWAELNERPTNQDLEILYTRIMTELRPKPLNPSNEPTTNGNDVVTPKLPDPNPPIWMTYSHNESQEMVADALNIPLSQLISYNNAFINKRDTKSQSFWSAPSGSANVVEKATVLIPVPGDIPPQRILLTRGAQGWWQNNTGAVIADHFGHGGNPEAMLAIATWRQKEPDKNWAQVHAGGSYEDFAVKIPAIRYSA